MSGREVSPETSGALRRGGRAMHFRPTPQVSNASNLGFQPGDCRHTPKSSPVGTKEYEPGVAPRLRPVRDEIKRDERRAQIESCLGQKNMGLAPRTN